MLIRLAALGFLISVCTPICALADGRPTVAVYVDRSSASPDHALQFAEQVTQSLVQAGQFSVIDREHVQTILEEQSAATAGQVTPATESQLGRMLGANYLIVVRIDSFNSAAEQRNDVISFLAKQASYVTKVSLTDSAELLDVKSAQIVQSIADHQQLTSSPSQSADPAFVNEAIPQVLKASADAIIGKIDGSKLDAKPAAQISGRILDVAGDSITLSVGGDAGLSVGQMLDYYDQRSIANPDTGKSIVTLIKRGSLQVVQVEKDYAIAKPISGGAGPLKFQVVRTAS